MTEIEAIIKGLERNGHQVAEVISFSDYKAFTAAGTFEVGENVGLEWERTFFVGNVTINSVLTGPFTDVNEAGILVTTDFFTGRGLVQRKRMTIRVSPGVNTSLLKNGGYAGSVQQFGIFANRFSLNTAGYTGASFNLSIGLDGLLFICR